VTGKRRDIIKNAGGLTYRSTHHRDYVFIQAHPACVGVTFTVLFRLFRRFHADADLFQTSIAENSGCTCDFVLYTNTNIFREEMIYVSEQRATIEELVG